jgi:hypothetical protein
VSGESRTPDRSGGPQSVEWRTTAVDGLEGSVVVHPPRTEIDALLAAEPVSAELSTWLDAIAEISRAANRIAAPDPKDVAHARRVIEAMGDGTGAVMLDGKMEDDASVKQCRVILELARELSARDPELAKTYEIQEA